jgi:hypothetical protein
MRRVISQHADHCTVANGADDALRLTLAYMTENAAAATAAMAEQTKTT